MRDRENISIDRVFEEKLADWQPSFEPSDWDSMESLLDRDKSASIWLVVLSTIKKRIKLLILLAMITTITTIALLALSPAQSERTTKNSSALLFSSAELQNESTGLPQNNMLEVEYVELTTKTSKGSHVNSIKSAKTLTNPSQEYKLIQGLTVTADGNDNNNLAQVKTSGTNDLNLEGSNPDTIISQVKKLKSVVDTAVFYKKVVSRRWVDTTWRYEYHKPERDIEDFWMGFYYTQQDLNSPFVLDIRGDQRVETHGFNLQFMSGNLLPGENLAIYGGFDWGMQFYGRSDESEVLINSVNEDRGLTFLRSHLNDLYLSGQIEWAQFPVVPYLTGSVGLRIFSTGQTTRALMDSELYESSTDNGVLTRAGLGFKYGAGLKVRLTPRMYLDARYEMVMGDEVDAVDYTRTSFNGLAYDVTKQRLNLDASQFRLGVVFDCSVDKGEKVVNKPGYWEEEEQILYMDPQDSSKVFVPCPCEPCDERSSNNNNYNNPYINMGGGSGGSGGSGSGGGGKSGFPGIKSPPGNRW